MRIIIFTAALLISTSVLAQSNEPDDLPLCLQQLSGGHGRYDEMERRAFKEIKALEAQKATLIEWLKQAQSEVKTQ